MKNVLARISAATSRNVRLVAVSKTKPKEAILTAFENGQTCFGENYVQELVEKAKSLPKKIDWHFIGHVQSAKVKDLCNIENLSFVETIDSIKLADIFQKRLSLTERKTSLNVMVQVNTSCEENKSGVKEDNAESLILHIIKNCDKLNFCGLMTIGKFGVPGTPYFHKLVDLKDKLLNNQDIKEKFNSGQIFELSMGMSGDFEEAIKAGSTNVRIGSTIFGART